MVTNEQTSTKVTKSTKGRIALVKFSFYYSRCDFESIEIIETEQEWAGYERAKKDNPLIYFGEIAGKHSEVEVEFEDITCEVLTECPKFIAKSRRIYGSHLGNMCLLDKIGITELSEESAFYVDPDDLEEPEKSELQARIDAYYKQWHADLV